MIFWQSMTKKTPPVPVDLSDADVHAELVRWQREWARRQQSAGQLRTMNDMEDAAELSKERAGHDVVEAMLQNLTPETGKSLPCPRCGKPVGVKSKGRARAVRTLSGEVTLIRNYHYCERCSHGFYPRDIELGLPEEGSLSEKMQARVLDFAVNDTFEQAASRWSVHYRQPISENLLRCVTERAGRQCEESDRHRLHSSALPVSDERAELLIIQNDGSMLPMRGEEPWKEVKMAVIYRVANTPNEKPAVRYLAVLGPQEDFRKEVRAALAVENAKRAKRIVWIADGARANWNLAYDTCLGATQILDWYHAIENATACASVLFEGDAHCVSLWKKRVESILLSDAPESVLDELRQCRELIDHSAQREALEKLLGYYFSNRERMQYAKFRAQGLPIGSGVVESAHRHVLQVRMKRAGQHWDYDNARRMVQLRALYRTTGPHDFHRAILSAANDNGQRLKAVA